MSSLALAPHSNRLNHLKTNSFDFSNRRYRWYPLSPVPQTNFNFLFEERTKSHSTYFEDQTYSCIQCSTIKPQPPPSFFFASSSRIITSSISSTFGLNTLTRPLSSLQCQLFQSSDSSFAAIGSGFAVLVALSAVVVDTVRCALAELLMGMASILAPLRASLSVPWVNGFVLPAGLEMVMEGMLKLLLEDDIAVFRDRWLWLLKV